MLSYDVRISGKKKNMGSFLFLFLFVSLHTHTHTQKKKRAQKYPPFQKVSWKMMDDDDFSEDSHDDDDDGMFLLDEEVPAHVSGRQKAGAKPAIRTKHHRIMKQTFKQTYKRRDDTRLSSSCPAKPLVGSLPIPELHNDMPALSLPATPASYDEGAKIISSLFTGCRVTGSSRKV